MAGWVRARGTAWAVVVGDVELDLLVSRPEMDFLRECCGVQHFFCWASGLVVMTRLTKMMVPDDMAVYYVGLGTPPLPTPALGRMLADNARTWSLCQTWSEIVRRGDSVRPRRVVHPLAMLAPPAKPLGDLPEVSIGYVFGCHVEAEVTSGTSKFFGSSTTMLGSSGCCFDHRSGTCSLVRDTSRPVEVVVARGCVVVANMASTLLLVANGACRYPQEAGAHCLVVTPREALPGLVQALADIGPVVATCVRELPESAALPALLVVTAEVAVASKRVPLIYDTVWDRVVICDWSRVVDTVIGRKQLRKRGSDAPPTLLRCRLQIALTLADSIQAALDRMLFVSELGLILGVQPLLLGCPSATKDLLCDRVLRIEDENAGDRAQVRRYDVIHFAPPTEEETEDSGAFSGYAATLACFLGPLASAGRKNIGTLPESMSLEGYFSERAGELTPFAEASFRDVGRERGCAICLSEGGATAVACCGHWFCARCITRTLSAGFRQCPVCRVPLPNPRDVVVQPEAPERTSYVKSLIRLLTPEDAPGKRLVVCSFASCLERVSRALRRSGVRAVAWSGNARQLQRNLETFRESADACMLCDPDVLSLRWVEDLADVRDVFCLLPLNTERQEVCCQLRTVLLQAPRARLHFVWCGDTACLPSEKPSCECDRAFRDCPFLVQGRGEEK